MSVSKPSRKKLWIILAAVAAVAVVAVAAVVVLTNQSVTPPAPPSGPNVTIWNGGLGCNNNGNCGYSPTVKTVTVGTNLTWTNTGITHTVTTCDSSHYSSSGCPSQNAAGLDSIDSGVLQKGAPFSHTFAVSGTYNYYCTLHPWMQGKVAVQ